jgi:pimeloyl-ACP methyl ester carboxylesterase
VLLDLAGHGESGTGRKDWTIAAFGGDVQAVVEALSLHEMILVGHSMGADVVLQSSVALGSRVLGLIWVDQYTQLDRLPDEATVRQRLERFHADFQGTMQALVRRLFGVGASPAMVERVTQHMSSVSPSVALPALEATWNHGRSVSKVLSQVRIPIVAINARSAPGDRESLQRRGINVIEVAETGHFPMLEQPERFAACLLQAANSLCGTQKAAIR